MGEDDDEVARGVQLVLVADEVVDELVEKIAIVTVIEVEGLDKVVVDDVDVLLAHHEVVTELDDDEDEAEERGEMLQLVNAEEPEVYEYALIFLEVINVLLDDDDDEGHDDEVVAAIDDEMLMVALQLPAEVDEQLQPVHPHLEPELNECLSLDTRAENTQPLEVTVYMNVTDTAYIALLLTEL